VELRKIGGSDLLVSAVGLGCNNFGVRCDLAQSRAVVDQAIDSGITLFDTADTYGNRGGSEGFLGRILGSRRRDVVIATKFGSPMDDAGRLKGASRRYVMTAVEASLTRLQTDWIDLYQLHRPDPATPIEETLRALDDLVRQGKVRYIGASNFTAAEVLAADRVARTNGLHRFTSMQNEYSLLARGVERELLPAVSSCELGLLPYFPLASGLLTGKYSPDHVPDGSRLATPRPHERAFIADADWTAISRFEQFARSRGRSLLELAFGWLLAQPTVASVIAGATRPEQIVQNVAAAEWRLTDEDAAEAGRLAVGGATA
jgi:aryl-alcohol dehydrogenase-like predicted oxidoreductase